MRKLSIFLLLLTSVTLTAQVSYNANTNVTPYNQPFRQAVNNGYFPGWINEQIADLSAGNQALNMPGVGARAMRVGFNEEIAELFGYDILKGLFRQYQNQGMGEHTMILGYPIDWHRDATNYCPTARSAMFKGMYLPIWDGGANGTPYNDDNYLAVYTYKMVSLYKDDIRFWEIWNEPGFDLTFSKGWLPPNQPGNWWQNDPEPCDIIFNAPVEHYIRTLRVSYDIIKTLDPDSYVCASGLGYPSFLDAILRNTDNPNGGGVSADYPLKGGAYFDAVGFHSYPHFDGSVRYWDNTLGQMVDTRHSDGAADGTIRVWQGYETVLNAYGYNGSTFPRKIKMITEGNIPRKAFDVGTPNESLGGTEVQRNYAIKNVVRLMQNGFAQYDLYQLFENKTLAAASAPYDVMGLYELPTAIGVTPPRTEHAIGYHTVSRMLFNTTYNATRTAAMNLPANVGGAAFLNPNGKYVYALWAKTQTDRSEFASATYSFPGGLGVTGLTRREWNFGQTGASISSPSANITLSSAPIFLTDDTAWPTAIVNPTNKVDLALSLTANPPNPTAGSNYTWSLTITNSSANNATGVEVGNFMEFEKQFILDRITYVSHVAPAGTTYTPLTGTWIIGSIPAGQSRTLTVTTKAVHGGIYKTFGQVTKCDQLDVDSSPLNGQAIKQPYEDDETFFIVNNNGFIDTKADIVIEATNYPANVNAGDFFAQNFMLRNNGRVGGPGFTTTIYLSTDAQFSANDVFLTSTNTAPLDAFAYKLNNFPIQIPAATTSGNYFLLYRCDFANQVDEADENNVFARRITVGGGVPTCSISPIANNFVCNNANTPNIASDDTWTFTLNVTGTNTGAGWTATVAGQTVTGTYGVPKTVSGGLISAGVRIFAVGDQNNPACATTLTLAPPPVCSTVPPCVLTAQVVNLVCGNASTPSNPNDDTFSFDLLVSGQSTGTWTTIINSQLIVGTFNQPKAMGSFLISAGAFTLNLQNDQVNCQGTVTITPPAPCSSGPSSYCQSKGDAPWQEWISEVRVGTGVQASTKTQYTDFTSKVFNVQNGTSVSLTTHFSWETFDQYWRIWIDLNGDGDFTDAGEQVFEGIGLKPANALNATKTTTGSLVLPASAPSANRRMRVAMKRGAFPTPCEIFAYGEVEDYTAAVTSGGTPTCNLTAIATNVQCFNANTFNITSDDTFSASLNVTTTGTGTNWTSVINGTTVTGTYGVAQIVQLGLISNGVSNFTIQDLSATTCTTQVQITPPPPCSNPNTCQVLATVNNLVCNDQGTAATSDDTYSFTVRVTGTGAGASWTGNFNGQNISGSYATDITIQGGLISGGQKILTVSAIDNPSCFITVAVTPPAPCSNSNPPGTYCASKGEAPWQEWMSEVRIGTAAAQVSTKSQYSDFTSKVWTAQNGTSVSLTSQFSWETFDEYWRIWIDLNGDGDFIDAGEQVFESLATKPANALNATKTTTGSLVIPSTTPSANRRMRVAMKRGAFPLPCETFANGEVEDYTVAVSGGGATPCALTYTVTNPICNNANTPLNPADDTWTFDLTVAGSQSLTGWTAWLNGIVISSGLYAVPKQINASNISSGPRVFVVVDNAQPTCTVQVTATPPPTCSSQGCNISTLSTNKVCIDAGTPLNPADDTWTFELLVTGGHTGTSWVTNIANQQITGSYGVAKIINAGLISDGPRYFTVSDNTYSQCTDQSYVVQPLSCSLGQPSSPCASKGEFPWEDWIGGVKVGGVSRPSGKSQYSDFTGQTALALSTNVPVELTASYSWFTYDEYFRIWIDLNKDGDFTDAGEQVFQGIATAPAASANATKVLTGNLALATVFSGTTRMRVSMKRGSYPIPCETFTNGEVEDYTVNLVTALQSSRPEDIASSTELRATKTVLTNNPTDNWTQIRFEEPTRAEAKVFITNQMGKVVEMQRDLPAGTETVDFFVGHLAKGMYFVRVEVDGEIGVVHRLVVLE
jgi:hypothetical protein